MGTDSLIPHPSSLPLEVSAIKARIVSLDANWLRLRWRIEGSEQLVVPPFAGRGRAEELWLTTCFEFFIMPEREGGYAEFNLSPSERWAAYDFAAYREGMERRAVPLEPSCTLRRGKSVAIFDAAIPSAALPQLPGRYALTAVIEEQGGAKSYWASAHPREKPDFHDPACFAQVLAAPESL